MKEEDEDFEVDIMNFDEEPVDFSGMKVECSKEFSKSVIKNANKDNSFILKRLDIDPESTKVTSIVDPLMLLRKLRICQVELENQEGRLASRSTRNTSLTNQKPTKSNANSAKSIVKPSAISDSKHSAKRPNSKTNSGTIVSKKKSKTKVNAAESVSSTCICSKISSFSFFDNRKCFAISNFGCPYCKFKALGPSDISEHICSAHTDFLIYSRTTVKYCPRYIEGSRKQRLASSKVKLLFCSKCPSASFKTKNLKNHHCNLRYTCVWCSYSTTKKDRMQAHVKNHR